MFNDAGGASHKLQMTQALLGGKFIELVAGLFPGFEHACWRLARH
ncbi:MAG: hypothetical protein ABWX85_03525 [Arthrobacter sp.]